MEAPKSIASGNGSMTVVRRMDVLYGLGSWVLLIGMTLGYDTI